MYDFVAEIIPIEEVIVYRQPLGNWVVRTLVAYSMTGKSGTFRMKKKRSNDEINMLVARRMVKTLIWMH